MSGEPGARDPGQGVGSSKMDLPRTTLPVAPRLPISASSLSSAAPAPAGATATEAELLPRASPPAAGCGRGAGKATSLP